MSGLGTAIHAGDATDTARATGVEIWAGMECTINRVADRYFDQLARTGHYARVEADIDRLAELGVRVLRYPVLWERHADSEAAWRVTDAAMTRMQAVGIDPIVGLVHHGSGPPSTTIASSDFSEGLARHARAVSQRYPWVRHFTPINEPLTTARFACLYGLWYPHTRDDRTFVRAMLEQVRATRMAMFAIREVRSDAELVQTEDVGHTHTTPPLYEQGVFENERRWLTMDLLLGRVVPGHPLYAFVARTPKLASLLAQTADAPCAPSLVGVNHYITSERFLDHRLERYPESTHGGNARTRYADVEAIRALDGGVRGARRLLRDVWDRYRIPIAITEAHLGCSREQQLCWLGDLVRAAHEAKEDGVDMRAVTAWAAFGSFDWPSLLTREDGVYESGLFDVRSDPPRATALAHMVGALARDGVYDHPVLDSPGWWHCDRRLTFPLDPAPRQRPFALAVVRRDGVEGGNTGDGVSTNQTTQRASRSPVPHGSAGIAPRRILVTGGNGTLGRSFEAICAERQLAAVTLGRQALDITDSRRVAEVLDEVRPWAVINAAGFVRVDDAEKERETCRWTNTIGPAVLADRCLTRGIAMVTFSSDLVFNGAKGEAYVESDTVSPINTYGRSKAEAERLVREIRPESLIIRTSAFFGEQDDHNFLAKTLSALASGKRVRVADDVRISPTYVPELVHATLDLLIDGETGTWHLANEGDVSWAELADMAARMAHVSTARLVRCANAELAPLAPRPRASVLRSERATLLHPLANALERWVAARSWERLIRRGGVGGRGGREGFRSPSTEQESYVASPPPDA